MTDTAALGRAAAGVALVKDGRLEEALDVFLALVGEHPSYARGWWYVGSVLRRLGRAEEALAYLEHAIALRPRRELYSVALFHASLDLGDLTRLQAEARRFLREVERGTECTGETRELYAGWLDDGPALLAQWVALNARASRLRRTTREDRIIRECLERFRADKDPIVTALIQGRELLRASKPAAAARCFAKAVSREPADWISSHALFFALLDSGDADAAHAEATRFIRLVDDGEIEISQGMQRLYRDHVKAGPELAREWIAQRARRESRRSHARSGKAPAEAARRAGKKRRRR